MLLLFTYNKWNILNEEQPLRDSFVIQFLWVLCFLFIFNFLFLQNRGTDQWNHSLIRSSRHPAFSPTQMTILIHSKASFTFISSWDSMMWSCFLVLCSLEALRDKCYCDRSLLLRCSPKCTQWCCFQGHELAVLLDEGLGELHALMNCMMIVDLFYCVLLYFVVPPQLLLLARIIPLFDSAF